MANSNEQDALLQVDSTLRSYADSIEHPAKDHAEQEKKTRMRKKISMMSSYNGHCLSRTNHIDIISNLSQSDEYHERKIYDRRDKIQSTVEDFGFSAREESRTHCSKSLITSSLETNDNVESLAASSSDLVQKEKKFEHESDQAIERSSVYEQKTIEVTLADRKSERNHPSCDLDATERACLAVLNREDNFVEVSHPSPERLPVACLRRKLLILDLNGLLADIVCPPPKEKIIDGVVDYLLGDMKCKLLFCWDISHCTGTGFRTLENKHKEVVFKELRKLWEKQDINLPWETGYYNESNTLLLDDSPYKALLNPMHTGIFPYSYNFKDRSDNSLGPEGDLRVYLQDLATAEDFRKYIEEHPFGQVAIDETSSSWAYYQPVEQDAGKSSVLSSVDELEDFAMGRFAMGKEKAHREDILLYRGNSSSIFGEERNTGPSNGSFQKPRSVLRSKPELICGVWLNFTDISVVGPFLWIRLNQAHNRLLRSLSPQMP
ncbi:hypothetical protein TEA_024476 [Camellia sinensis var. sinensis]|uniref:Mitochondrial import inner membrane translocase subunit TIM50 n=1 Tax=Camellia sinensis var. sinensis TaxID=542762 RepID=A0A4S4DPS8_CAMSN|nr:hypothetical protein TEA_024476 [Camellia sinensis var. sinensis]